MLYATMLARSVPEAPCSVLLDPEEWQALSCALHRVAQPPPEPPSLAQAVQWIAQLGGFVAHRDGPPVREMGTPAISKIIGYLEQLATPTHIDTNSGQI